METTKISLQSGRLSLSAEGSEAFVREAMTFWSELRTTAPSDVQQTSSKEEVAEEEGEGQSSRESHQPKNTGISQYDHVFDVADDQLKIIATIAIKSKAQQTRAVALLVLYGHALMGMDHVASEVIRSACVDQGCYDGPNFATTLKGLKPAVVMNTKTGGIYDVKLTAPGRKQAKELADKLQQGDV